MGLGEISLGEMGLGEMGLGEMGQNRSKRRPKDRYNVFDLNHNLTLSID